MTVITVSVSPLDISDVQHSYPMSHKPEVTIRGVGATGASQALALVDFQRCSENFIAKSNL